MQGYKALNRQAADLADAWRGPDKSCKGKAYDDMWTKIVLDIHGRSPSLAALRAIIEFRGAGVYIADHAKLKTEIQIPSELWRGLPIMVMRGEPTRR